VTVTDTRQRGDGAYFVRHLVDEQYRHAEPVVLVMDPRNIHAVASFYEVFPPDEARRLTGRLEIHHTPQHGSWLNRAEIEWSVRARDLPERVGTRAALEQRTSAGEQRRNHAGVKADWQFTTTEARIKLRKLYPTVEN
jgi:DDE superfamily endonuclease